MIGADIWWLIIIVVFLIIASAFFSSAETALTAASDARMRQLASKGSHRAQPVERLRADREGLTGTILTGNNALNVVPSAIATSVATPPLGETALLSATLTMTALRLLLDGAPATS